jgi:hypothetical protein
VIRAVDTSVASAIRIDALGTDGDKHDGGPCSRLRAANIHCTCFNVHHPISLVFPTTEPPHFGVFDHVTISVDVPSAWFRHDGITVGANTNTASRHVGGVLAWTVEPA